jgi:hypothetical protein
VQALRRAPEVQLLRDRDEVAQVPEEVHDTALISHPT